MKIDFSPAALAKIEEILNEQGKKFFRIALQAGGCNGMTYIFSADDKASPADHVFCESNCTVLIDKKSGIFLHNSLLDWEESLMRKGFKISNPQQKAECSCGKSFSV